MDDSSRNFVSGLEMPDLAALLTGEDLCALCAEQGTCCCRTDPEDAHLSFPLSAAEWRRIAPYAFLALMSPDEPKDSPCRLDGSDTPDGAGVALQPLSPFPDDRQPPEDGDATCVAEANSPEFLQAMGTLFPREKERLERLFPKNGRHLRMKVRPDGSCVFQGKAGCRLPRTLRPWYCVLFPGWVQGNAVTLFMSETCLISRRATSPAHGLKLMHTPPEEVRRLHAALRKDWGLPL